MMRDADDAQLRASRINRPLTFVDEHYWLACKIPFLHALFAAVPITGAYRESLGHGEFPSSSCRWQDRLKLKFRLFQNRSPDH